MDSRTDEEKEKVKKIGTVCPSIRRKESFSKISRRLDFQKEIISKMLKIMETNNIVFKATVDIMQTMWKAEVQTQKRLAIIEGRFGITEKEVNAMRKLRSSWKPYISILKKAIANQQKYLEENR
jgi:hypothetical protein